MTTLHEACKILSIIGFGIKLLIFGVRRDLLLLADAGIVGAGQHRDCIRVRP